MLGYFVEEEVEVLREEVFFEMFFSWLEISWSGDFVLGFWV